MSGFSELVRERVMRSISVKQKLLKDAQFHQRVCRVAEQIVKSLHQGGKVLFFGNGGSAADAQHLAAEFTGRYLRDRRPLPALALTTNSSALTAIGNDYGFELVFARALEALGREGDVAVGITTSGNSPNVVRAMETARAKSIFGVALTGASGGVVEQVADCTICIPSEETPRIQECHILIGHLICEIVEEMICEQTEAEALESALQPEPVISTPRSQPEKELES
jgi:D-sedoheptulose 7-phosphate isomerase